MRTALICACFLALAVLSSQAKPQEQELGRVRAAREADPVPDPKRKMLKPKKKVILKKKAAAAKRMRTRKVNTQGLGRAIVVKGNGCEYITLADLPSNTGCGNGNKFVLKGATGVRKQFLIMTSGGSDKAMIAFVTKQTKFTACTSVTDITTTVTCKAVPNLSAMSLSALAEATTAAGAAAATDAAAAATTAAAAAAAATTAASGTQASILNKRVNLTHATTGMGAAHGAYGYAELINTTTVRLDELYYDGFGPKTNWIVGTNKTYIGLTAGTVIIDKLTSAGAPFYPDDSDISATGPPTLPKFDNSTYLLTLPVVDGTQMTWSDVAWLALYCRKVLVIFMHVDIPGSFN